MLLSALNLRAARRCLLAAALIAAAGDGNSACAQEPTLAEMDHAMWTARDGAPQGVTALSQAPDGILWIGSEGGLYSFDGRSFSTFQPQPGEPDLPAGPVYSVLAARDGAVWVGFYLGGAARIWRGHVTLFTRADDQRLWAVQDIRQTSDGSIWALSAQQRLVRFGGDGTWHVEPIPAGNSGGRIRGIFIDSSDTLWLAQGGRLYRRPLIQSTYEATDVEADWTFGFAEAPDRSIWVTDVMTAVDRGRTQHVDRLGKLLTRLADAEEAYSILYSPGGDLIMASQYHGLRRFAADALTDRSLAAPRAAERYTQLEGLSSDAEDTLLLDADGNIWAGGQRGLDRFKKARLTPFIAKKPGGKWGICATRQGDVWVSSDTNQLYKVSAGTTESFLNVGDIYSMFCGDDGDIWLVDHAGIWEMHAGRIKPVQSIPGTGPYGVNQVVVSSHHTLFVSASGVGRGLWQYEHHQWTKVTGTGIPANAPSALYLDSEDRVWTGYSDGRVGQPLEGAGLILSSGNPGLGLVRALLETLHGVFAAGVNGLAVLRKKDFEMLSFADRASSRGVAGLVESRNGDLWLNGARGIVHVSATDLQAALDDPRHLIKSELVTEGDFVGPVRLFSEQSTAARDAHGNLWFATLNGVLHVDPEHLNSQSHLPILSIRSIAVDRNPLSASGAIGPRPQTLDIQYLGVNLTAPDKVIYQYRLDGLDDSWQDAGHRTEAIYTHLRPGNYIFQVIASNGNGIWTAPVAAKPFSVLPSFYQTAWFAALCGLAGLLLLWFIVMARVRAITRVIRARAEERADERIRISRDLHDTLLQGIQGLLLTFHVAAQKLAAEGESKHMLEKALATADRIIIEGRNRVNSLRAEHLTDAELFGSLENVGKDLNLDDRVQFHVTRSGSKATLRPHVADEVLYIAREAVTNAFRHSGGSQISLALIYGKRYFSMSCSDNGRGFDPKDEEKLGHWGLKGMLERALKLGGQLCCRSKSAQGTEILFAIPSYRAYENHSRLMFHLRALHLSERNPIGE